ncbi:MAG: D-alanyl-D-alanine carboxypeptidase [Clostridia bacterium]|nr:D-alanyl-D-alanine carboxypeptidase [Clostridia bacterium]
MLPSFAVSDLPDMSGAKAVYLYNIEQKRVMAEKDADAEVYPASTTKLMTGIVALDALSGRLDEQITVTAEMLKGVTGNNMGLKAGEQIVIRDVLYGMICGSANDAAAVLAHISAGSIEGFVALMNKKAIELGAIDTNYTNVSGMHDPAMVTTAYDTFLIAKAASENPVFVEMSSESKYHMPKTNLSCERNVYKKNLLISRYSETKYFNRFVKGLNSGSTTQGGYCLAAYAENEGQSYICIVLGAEERNGNICSYTVANALIDWAYSSYGYVEVLSKDRLVCEVAVELSDDVDYVTLRPIESLTVFLPLDTDIESGLKYSHKLTSTTLEAPVEEGQIAGFITVELDGEILGTVDLVTMNKVERSEFLYGMKRVRDFTTSRPFIISAVTFGLLITVYIFVTAFYRKDTQRRKRRRR